MDYHFFKDIINRIYANAIDAENRPTYFDINETCPSLNRITENYKMIQKEFYNIHAQFKNLPAYHDIDPGEWKISNTTEKKWNVFMLYLLGFRPNNIETQCPETFKLIQKIPNLVQAFFSILEPGKSVPLHEGPYLGYLRYHLGLHIPKDHPPRIIINNQPYTWKEGEAVMFDDSWPHEVQNQSQDYRAVLIIDVLRPMPLGSRLLNKFVTNVIAKHTYGRNVIKRVNAHTAVIN